MGKSDKAAAAHAGLRLGALWYATGVLMLLLVAVLSLLPVPDTGVGDKFAHTLTYFLLAGWFSLLPASRRTLGLIFIGLLAYGISIELLQGMTAYRYAEWGDVVANAIGTAAGTMLYFTPLTGLLRFFDRRLARLLLR